MTKHQFKAQPRSVSGRKVKKLREQGVLPANVFGKGVTSKTIQLDSKNFSTLRKQVGDSTLLYLSVEGEKEERPVLVREVVAHPVTGKLLHVSFNQVNLKEKVLAPVAIELTGESLAEKDKLGILVTQLTEVEIEALPTDMPENITLDISNLSNVGDSIKVGDLKLSDKLTVTTDPETIIVKVEPLAEEEKVETEAPAETTEAAETATAPTEAPAEEA
jgi:large subunit ribosomal protein L25